MIYKERHRTLPVTTLAILLLALNDVLLESNKITVEFPDSEIEIISFMHSDQIKLLQN